MEERTKSYPIKNAGYDYRHYGKDYENETQTYFCSYDNRSTFPVFFGRLF